MIMKFNKILSLPALALTLFGLGACSDEVKYDPAQPEANAEVYFAAATPTTVALENDQNVINIPIYRANTSGAITVAMSSSQTLDGEPINIFSVPGDVTFADGSDVAIVSVNLDFSNIEANKQYSLTMSIEDAAQTPYGKRMQTFSISYAPWSEWKLNNELAAYTFGSFYDGTYDCVIRERSNLLDPTQKQIMIVGEDDSSYGKYGIYEKSVILNWNTTTNDIRINPPQPDAMTYQGTKLTLTDVYTFLTEIVSTDKYDANDYISSIDPETGMITLNVVFYFVQDGKVYNYPFATEFLQLPGYPDYSMYFANNGTQITEQGEELAVLTIAKGSDVNGFALKLVPGYLSDAQIEKVADKIKEDENVTLYYDGGDYTFPIAEDGDQTLVAVTYDAMGQPIGVQSYHFYYEIQMKDWNEGWTSLGKMIYTDYLVFNKPLSWEVEVQQNDEEPGYLRIVKPYGACPGLEPEEIERGHYYIYLDVTDPDKAMILPSVVSYSALTVVSESYLMKNDGESTDADVASAGMWGTWKDNTLTMPVESFGFFRGFTDTGWTYHVLNDVKAEILKPVPADDDDEPGLGTQSLSAPAVKVASFAGTNGFPVKKSKDAKKNRKFVSAAPLQF